MTLVLSFLLGCLVTGVILSEISKTDREFELMRLRDKVVDWLDLIEEQIHNKDSHDIELYRKHLIQYLTQVKMECITYFTKKIVNGLKDEE